MAALTVTQRSLRRIRYPGISDEDLVQVAVAKGSVVFFNRLMQHTNDLNRSDQHRFVQYVTMSPATFPNKEDWSERWLVD